MLSFSNGVRYYLSIASPTLWDLLAVMAPLAVLGDQGLTLKDDEEVLASFSLGLYWSQTTTT